MIRLPERWGRFHGIEGLPMIIAASEVVVFLFDFFSPGFTARLLLYPPALSSGEYWRLVTFLFIPPPVSLGPVSSLVLVFFWAQLLYTYAQALENQWGTFRFNVYYVVGAVATACVGFYNVPGLVTNSYLHGSLLLAFSTLFPEFELLLFFVLPVKMKYLGYFTWFVFAWGFFTGSALTRWTIAAALVNYLLLLGPDLWDGWRLRIQVARNRRRWKP